MSINDNIAGQVIDAGASSANALREQTRLFRAVCESLQLFLDAVAKRDVVGIEEPVRLQGLLCARIEEAQKGAKVDITEQPGIVIEGREDARKLLQEVSALRSRLQTASALLPRLRQSTKVMLGVLGGEHSCSHARPRNERLV